MKYIKPDKIFYHPDRLSQWMNEETVKPITAEIHLSNRCNNACTYCGQKQNQNGKDMSIENIKMLRKFVNYSGVKSVYFSGGGESTLNKDLFTAIDELKNIELGMITNGLVMPDNLIDRYVKEFRWVRISIDAANNETYKNIRGTNSFEQVKSNITRLLTSKRMNNSNVTVGLQIVVNEYNYDQLFFIITELTRTFTDIDYINIRPIEMKINETPYTQKQLETIESDIKFFKEYDFHKLIISDKWNMIFADKKEFGFKICNAAEFLLTIGIDGDIYPCCHVLDQDDYRFNNIEFPEDFLHYRKQTLSGLKNKGFNPLICPFICRGSGINQTLYNMILEKHRNFL